MKKNLLAVIFSLLCIGLNAQSVTVSGHVFGFLSEKVVLLRNASKNVSFEGPVSGAKLHLNDGENDHVVYTDVTGTYSFVLSKPGDYKLKIECKDYSSISMNIHYGSAGLKTYYPAVSFILKKGDVYLYPVGDLYIEQEGELRYVAMGNRDKKRVEDVVLSNQLLFDKTIIINNASKKNVLNMAKPITQIQKVIVGAVGTETLNNVSTNDTVISKSRMFVNDLIVKLNADSSMSIEDLKNKIQISREALAKIDPNDESYAVLLAQIKNAEQQLKNREEVISLQAKELESSKKIILYLCLFALFALVSVFLLLFYLRKRKEHMMVLDEKNKNITRINTKLISSIKYAAMIQSNFFKDKKVLKKLFAESFIFNQPKDLLSGDFYWFTQKNNCKIVVVADCTGHGVPGALLTILGHSLLEEIVNVQGEVLPSKILMNLNQAVMSAFSRTEDLEYGMDITVISQAVDSNELVFSGMTNGLYHVRKNKLAYYSVTPKTIGGDLSLDDLSDQRIEVEKGDCLYMISDGYCDQFGARTDVIEKYNVKRLEQLFSRLSTESNFSSSEQILKTELDAWKGPREQVDDVLVLGIKI